MVIALLCAGATRAKASATFDLRMAFSSHLADLPVDPATDTDTRPRKEVLIVAGLGLVLASIAFLTRARWRRTREEPIERLAAIATRIATSRDYSVRAERVGRHELSRLTDTFNGLLSSFQAQHTEMQFAHEQLEKQLEHSNGELQQAREEITAHKQLEFEHEQLHRRLLETARAAGMAEMATNVLHNVGNVLNSVNVSATLVSDTVRNSKAGNLAKTSALLAENEANLATFLTVDSRGKMIQPYLATLAVELAREQQTILIELAHLRKNVDHIKDIVAMQQSYAKTSGLVEASAVTDLVEDAVRMNAGSLLRHDIQIERDYQAQPVVVLDKHQVLQILVNLIRNAKYACDESGRPDKCITLRVTADQQTTQIAVADNGIGIAPENITRIFNHGFTTRATGHGFGLHSGALAAKAMGGSLVPFSEGRGHGATFVLTLPLARVS